MRINLENYEQYALDYLEGGLTSDKIKEFEQFLQDHPEIEQELAELADIRLLPNMDTIYPHKEKLYRSGNYRMGLFPLFHWSVAASVLLVIGFGLFFRQWNPGSNISDFSKISEEKEKQVFPDEEIKTGIVQKEDEKFFDGEEEIAIRSEESGSLMKFQIPDEDIPNSFAPPELTAQEGESKELAKIEIKAPEIEVDPEELNQLAFVRTEFHEEHSLVQPLEAISISTHKVVYSSSVQSRIKDIEKQSSSSRTFHVHLPDEFFSEAWRDLSLNNIKGKLIPEFLTKSK